MATKRTIKQQLSNKQFAVLTNLLERGSMTTREVGLATDTDKGTGAMLQALYQQGLILYKGGPGVKPGKGKWLLTDRGTQAAREQI